MLSRLSFYPLLAAMSLGGLVSSTPLPTVKQATVGMYAGTLELTPSTTPFLYCEGTSGNVSYIFQDDANFVVYDQYHNPVWYTGTGGHTCAGNNCTMAFQADGNLVIYYNRTPIWYTETGAGAGKWLWFSNMAPYMYIINFAGGMAWESDAV